MATVYDFYISKDLKVISNQCKNKNTQILIPQVINTVQSSQSQKKCPGRPSPTL